MNPLARLLLPAAVLLACAAPLFAAEAVELKQRLIVGKQYSQTIETSQSATIAIGDQKMDQKTTMTMELTMAVSAHEDGTRKRATIKYGRMAMGMDMNGQKMGFDSAKPGDGADPMGLSKSLGAVVGQEMKLVLSATDEVSEVENSDEFVKKFPPAALPGMDMAKMFNKEAMAQVLKQGALLATPGKPVQPGDSWPFTSTIEMPQMGAVAVKGTYTFKGLTDHDGVLCAEIAMVGEIALDLAKAPAQVAQLGMKADGTLKGTVWFDPKLGFGRDSQTTQELNMTMKNPADPAATMKIPMKQEIRVKLTKVGDLK